MDLVFDIGMYDGSDTRYYLSEGFKVIAVEANPHLIDQAKIEFRKEISSGQLKLIHAAIFNESGKELNLSISGSDLGSSSIIEGFIAHKIPIGNFNVNSITITKLIEDYGTPYFIKIDIEGADKYAVLPLTKDNKPRYISFEAGCDSEEIIDHLNYLGYTKFKAINQCNFNELTEQDSIIFRIKRKIIHLLGYSEPRYVRLNGRFFLLGHSAGPAPWASAGKWQNLESFQIHWKSNNKLGGWYDIHAM